MGLPKKIDTSAATPLDPKKKFVLGSIKAAIRRVEEIRQEMENAGCALDAGYITPQQALDWVEEVAPLTLGYIPPLTGLGLKRDGGDNE
jgi:hypothetical protein